MGKIFLTFLETANDTRFALLFLNHTFLINIVQNKSPLIVIFIALVGFIRNSFFCLHRVLEIDNHSYGSYFIVDFFCLIDIQNLH